METCFCMRWLSCGKVLQRFVDMLPEIKAFLSKRNEKHEDLGFLTDLTAKLNSLNNELQGKDRHLPHMISAVNAFKAKLCVWTTHLKKGRLTHFTNLEKMSESIKDSFTLSSTVCTWTNWQRSSVDVLVS